MTTFQSRLKYTQSHKHLVTEASRQHMRSIYDWWIGTTLLILGLSRNVSNVGGITFMGDGC